MVKWNGEDRSPSGGHALKVNTRVIKNIDDTVMVKFLQAHREGRGDEGGQYSAA